MTGDRREADPLDVTEDDLAGALFYVYGNVTRRGPAIGPDRPGPREGYRSMPFWQADARIILDWLRELARPRAVVVPPRSLASQTNGYRPRTARHVYRAALLAAGVALVLAGVAVGRATATPRTAAQPELGVRFQPLPEAPHGASSPSSPPATGTRPALTGDSPDLRTPPATSDIGTAIESGTASFVDPSYGSRYLALPEGPGVRVTICHGSVCVIRTSTDAGPDLAMQRAGRVADLSWADFRRLCRCDPYVVGLLLVTVDYGGPSVTPPATSTEDR